MADEKNNLKKVQHLIDALQTGQLENQLEAVDAMRAHGNEMIIEPILIAWQKTKSHELKAEIEDLLNTIKSSAVPNKIMNCLRNENYSSQRIILLSSIWNSGLDYSSHVAELIQIATESEVTEIFEIETILDNMETLPSDEVLSEALLILGNFLNENKNLDSTKSDMLIHLGVILKRMNED